MGIQNVASFVLALKINICCERETFLKNNFCVSGTNFAFATGTACAHNYTWCNIRRNIEEAFSEGKILFSSQGYIYWSEKLTTILDTIISSSEITKRHLYSLNYLFEPLNDFL